MIKLKKLIPEFKEDLMKQCIVLMGLPAAGKSTFINADIKKYIPRFSGYKVTASDKQVNAAQYQYAKSHYEWLLKNIKNVNDIKKFVGDSKYIDNDNNDKFIPLTYNWWKINKDKGLKTYYKTFYKSYYATYFDIRDMARAKEKQLFNTKVITSGDMLIFDTTAANVNNILGRLKQTKENDFNNTIIFLEIDVNLAIKRDKWRKENQGRGVGESVVIGFSDKIKQAYGAYKKEGEKSDGVVDRLLHFVWKPAGSSPINGSWNLIEDKKYFLKRKKKND